jgi:hypothetical protein
VKNRKYHTLIASLPYLPRFDRVERLPINEIRLRQREKLLEPEDARIMGKVIDFLQWHRQPITRTATEVATLYSDAVKWSEGLPLLKENLKFRKDLRFIMAALRRHRQDRGVPELGKDWDMDELAHEIVRKWEKPYFGLSAQFRWIVKAKSLLDEQDAVALEKLMLGLSWDKADQMSSRNPFGFETFLGYLFKWDITRRWLLYDQEKAGIRFHKLTQDAVKEGNFDASFTIE